MSKGSEPIQHCRAFVAIPIEERAMQAVANFQRALQEQLVGSKIRWIAPAQLHLTLQFLGNVSLAVVDQLLAALRTACESSSPFYLGLGALGCFPDLRAPRILWVGLSGDLAGLHELQGRIAAQLAPLVEVVDERPFQSHLTIGRVKDTDRPTLRMVGRIMKGFPNPPDVQWKASEVLLLRSRLSPAGAIYDPLARISL